MKTLTSQFCSLLSAITLASLATAADRPALRVNEAEVDEAVLFAFDDHAIPHHGNLQLTMERAERNPTNPVLAIGPMGTPDEWQIRFYGTILPVDGKFRMWYIAAAADGFVNPMQGGALDRRGWRFAYAESPDGIAWTKPKLGLTEFRGQRDNNLLGLPAGFRGYHALVLHEPSEPDATRRFKMMALLVDTGDYQLPGPQPDPARWSGHNVYVPLYSADGTTWRVADELVSDGSRTFSPKFNLVRHVEGAGLYRWNGMYYLSGQAIHQPLLDHAAMPPYGRHVQLWRSADLLNWSETSTMAFAREGQYARPPGYIGSASTSPIQSDTEQTHEGASVWNRGNVLLGVTGFWHGSKDWTKITHPLALLVSNDGLHFREPQPEFEFGAVGQRGRDWDHSGLGQGQAFANVGDKTYIWYGAPMDQSGGPRTGGAWPREGGVGLLMFGRDRFGSLGTRDADRDGTLVTTAIETRRAVRVFVNADGLGPESRLRLEVLDSSEHPIAGYDAAPGTTVTQSGLEVPVTWSNSDRLPAGTTLRLRIRFEGRERNAIRLFAVYLRP
jgi:hypothetical protein